MTEGAKTDPFPKMLAALAKANIAVVIAAGNNAETNPDLTQNSPQKWGGSSTPYIVVGAADQNGLRGPFSNYRDSNRKGIFSLYNHGVNVLSVLPETSSFFKSQDGTSQAAALTSGLLSALIGQGQATPQLAKETLQRIGTTKKGPSWLVDNQRLPVVPPATTNNEIPCPTGMSPNSQSPFVARYVDLGNALYRFTQFNLVDYSELIQQVCIGLRTLFLFTNI